jgi:hypothetical protein
MVSGVTTLVTVLEVMLSGKGQRKKSSYRNHHRQWFYAEGKHAGRRGEKSRPLIGLIRGIACGGRYACFPLHLVLHHGGRKPAGFRIARDATAGQRLVRSGGEGWPPGIRAGWTCMSSQCWPEWEADVRHRCATSRSLAALPASYRSPRPARPACDKSSPRSRLKNTARPRRFGMKRWI